MCSNRGSLKSSARVRFLLTTDPPFRVCSASCPGFVYQFADKTPCQPCVNEKTERASLLVSSRVYIAHPSRGLGLSLVGVSYAPQPPPLLLEQELWNHGGMQAGPVTWPLQHFRRIKISRGRMSLSLFQISGLYFYIFIFLCFYILSLFYNTSFLSLSYNKFIFLHIIQMHKNIF